MANNNFSVTANPELEDDRNDINYVPAPCQVACPVGTDAPSYIGYVWEGENEKALEAINATNPFSAICGRVCDAPCEPACRRADSDGAIAIRNLKRYVLDALGDGFALPPVAVTKTKTVAVVGGGPAGLTAAHDLAEAGYEVHVHEATDRLGGMMVWGIPRFRLPEGVIDQDINRITKHCPGIKIHLNSALGQQVTLDSLKQQHAAVLLSIGAFVGKAMGVENETQPFVEDGVSFLRRINAGERPSLPETVLVIGGGDVSMDACRAAARMPGVKTVKIVYRRDATAMPARKEELHGAMEEGIEIVYNAQPVGVVPGQSLRCVRTEMGAADADGRRRPLTVEGSEFEIQCGLIIAAVGQKAECSELEDLKLMNWDRVQTNWEGMSTADPQVFAAGDGAFGGSTIVEAMHHGHRAAYYMKAFLEGNAKPLTYRTPYRTRRVPICNDPQWEINPRIDQHFHGMGEQPIKFMEIESTYTPQQAKAEAARCFRCDAETGSADYTVDSREAIFAMARLTPEAIEESSNILKSRLENRENPYGEDHQATLDDLVFLPANLSRLVIDPYREGCKTHTELGGRISIALDTPFLITGLDNAPESVISAYCAALKDAGAAYVGAKPLAGAKWLQIVDDAADSTADAVAFSGDSAMAAGTIIRARNDQSAGIILNQHNLEAGIEFALAQAVDFVILDAGNGLPGIAAELEGAPDLSIMRNAVRQLRQLDREEEFDLIYFGGLRTGTDGAKMLALGGKAVVLGSAAVLALGADISSGQAQFRADLSATELGERCANLLQAFTAEASMMARCTGKTNLHNLEPEDLRAITLVASAALALPMAGSLNTH